VKVRLVIAGLILSSIATTTTASTLGGVFGPGIKEGDRSLQWRMAYVPDEDANGDIWAGRLHYQHSFSNRIRARFWAAFNDVETGEIEPKFLQAELHWQLKKFSATSNWATGVRFDYRLTENDDGNDKVGLVWTNQWKPANKWVVTHAIFALVETGAQSKSGVDLESRSAVDYSMQNGYKVGLHSFNTFGNSKALRKFDSQNHRLGPTVSGKLGKHSMFLFGPLFGVTDGSKDVDIRLWIGHSFDW